MPSDRLIARDERLAHDVGFGAHRRRARRRRRVRGVRHGAGLCDRHAASTSLGSLLTLGVARPTAARLAGDDAGRLRVLAVARAEGGARVCVEHAGPARGDVARVPRQPDGVSAHQRPAAVRREGRLRVSIRPGSATWSPRFAGGALLGSIVLSHAGAECAPAAPDDRRDVAWYALLLVFAQMPRPARRNRAAWCSPASRRASRMVPLSIILLRAADEKFRGRVMGVRMMAIYSLPIGLLGGRPADRVGRLPRRRRRSTRSSESSSRWSSRCAGAPSCGGRELSGKQRREGER